MSTARNPRIRELPDLQFIPLLGIEFIYYDEVILAACKFCRDQKSQSTTSNLFKHKTVLLRDRKRRTALAPTSGFTSRFTSGDTSGFTSKFTSRSWGGGCPVPAPVGGGEGGPADLGLGDTTPDLGSGDPTQTLDRGTPPIDLESGDPPPDLTSDVNLWNFPDRGSPRDLTSGVNFQVSPPPPRG